MEISMTINGSCSELIRVLQTIEHLDDITVAEPAVQPVIKVVKSVESLDKPIEPVEPTAPVTADLPTDVKAAVEEAPAQPSKPTRVYSVKEIIDAGTALNNAGKLPPTYFAEVMKGKPITAMSPDELQAIAEDLKKRGAAL